jgi:DNA-binding response OmpR family regulator
MSNHILLIEDNTDISEMIGAYLEKKHYEVDYAQDGLTASHLAATNTYDLIVLDIMLPGVDGLTLCQSFRHQLGLKTPIIMLTAKDTIEDKITGFNAGADDYLVKPFSILELEARIKSHLKRHHNTVTSDVLRIADLELNNATLFVSRNRTPLSLTPTNFKLLALLMKSSPNVVNRGDIEKSIWGNEMPDSDALRSHMYTLRKVVDKPFDKKLIKTHQSSGYQIIE